LGRKAAIVVGEDGGGNCCSRGSGCCWLLWQLVVWLRVSGREGGRGGIFAKKIDSRVLAREDLLAKYTATVDARIDAPYSICALTAVCALDRRPF
jgi:hypothetical protein